MLTVINLPSLIPAKEKIFGGSWILEIDERVDVLLITTDSLIVDR